jgi:hypothetical protein
VDAAGLTREDLDVKGGERGAFVSTLTAPSAVVADWGLIVTTNYDRLLEGALAGKPIMRSSQTSTAINYLNGTIGSFKRSLSLLHELTHNGTLQSTYVSMQMPQTGILRLHGTLSAADLSASIASFESAPRREAVSFSAIYSQLARLFTRAPCIKRPWHDLAELPWYRPAAFDLGDSPAEPTAEILVKVTRTHAEILFNAYVGLLRVALSAKASLVRALAHITHAASGALAIIAVFMSHRHRREPAGKRCIPKTSMPVLAVDVKASPWRVAVGR